MLTIQLTIKGASYNLLAIGDDNEKEAFINLCYNWHIISRLPEYDNEPLQSDRKRLYRGLLLQTMSKHEVLTNQMRHKAYRGKATRCVVETAHTVKAWLNWKRGVSVALPEETIADNQDEDDTQAIVAPSIKPAVSVAKVERVTTTPCLSHSVPVAAKKIAVNVSTVERHVETNDGLTEFERELLADI